MSILSLQSSLGDGLAKSLEHPAIEGGGSMPEHTPTLSNCHSVPNGPRGTLGGLMSLWYQKGSGSGIHLGS